MPSTSALCSFALFLSLVSAARPAQADLKVTLLGTGTPIPIINRFGPSTLVEAGPEKLLIDCGRGASQRLWQLHIPLSAVTAVFLTHLHSDHVVGIPDLWLTGWLPTPFGGRSSAFRIWGPRGTKDMMANLERAYAWDIQVRAPDENLRPAGVTVVAQDVEEGVVYEKNGVKVTAFTVDHGPLIKPALGYRVDYNGHSVVISGDTRPTENLVKFAQGTDVLIHEVADARPELLKISDAARRIIGHHTRPAEAGRIFSRVRPRLAVYSHIALLTTESAIPPPTMDDIVAATRTTYAGPLQVGSDLMTIEIGSTVTGHQFAGSKD
jgi:ribonuclease Z